MRAHFRKFHSNVAGQIAIKVTKHDGEILQFVIDNRRPNRGGGAPKQSREVPRDEGSDRSRTFEIEKFRKGKRP